MFPNQLINQGSCPCSDIFMSTSIQFQLFLIRSEHMWPPRGKVLLPAYFFRPLCKFSSKQAYIWSDVASRPGNPENRGEACSGCACLSRASSDKNSFFGSRLSLHWMLLVSVVLLLPYLLYACLVSPLLPWREQLSKPTCSVFSISAQALEPSAPEHTASTVLPDKQKRCAHIHSSVGSTF